MVLLLYLNPYCAEDKDADKTEDSTDIYQFSQLRMNCEPHQYNTMSLLSFGTPEIAVKGIC